MEAERCAMHLALACFGSSWRWALEIDRGDKVREQAVDEGIYEVTGETMIKAGGGSVPVGGMHGGGGAEICCDAHICDILEGAERRGQKAEF